MTNERIQELANKGFITQINELTELVEFSEKDLIEKGIITQTSVFDGDDSTTEEVIETSADDQVIDEPVEEVETPAEPIETPEIDEPVVDEGDEDIE